MSRRPVLALALALAAAAATAALLLFGLAVAAPSSAAPAPVNACFDSVPEPGGTAPTKICYTLFQPEGASAQNPVPMVLHGHGWGGSRTRTVSGDVKPFVDAGYGVIPLRPARLRREPGPRAHPAGRHLGLRRAGPGGHRGGPGLGQAGRSR